MNVKRKIKARCGGAHLYNPSTQEDGGALWAPS